MKRVEMIGGVNYERITPQGVFVTYGEKRADGQIIECDTVVLCAGHEPLRDLAGAAQGSRSEGTPRLGADEAGELTQASDRSRHAAGRPALARPLADESLTFQDAH